MVAEAVWDEELLAEELGALMDLDLDFDVGITGFSIAEIDGLIEAITPEEPGDPADDLLPNEAPARCRPGDIWQLGRHRLICGDALDPETVDLLMDGKAARMVFTDPPYNVPIDGHVGGSGKVKHREFAMAAGKMSVAQFTEFLQTTFRNLAEHSLDGAIHFVCMDWRHMGEVLAAADGIYAGLKNLIVWVKDNGGMGTFCRSRHELVFAFEVGTAAHVNSFELGQHGRYPGASCGRMRCLHAWICPPSQTYAALFCGIRDMIANACGLRRRCRGFSSNSTRMRRLPARQTDARSNLAISSYQRQSRHRRLAPERGL